MRNGLGDKFEQDAHILLHELSTLFMPTFSHLTMLTFKKTQPLRAANKHKTYIVNNERNTQCSVWLHVSMDSMVSGVCCVCKGSNNITTIVNQSS